MMRRIRISAVSSMNSISAVRNLKSAILLGALLCFSAEAQQVGKLYRIGVLVHTEAGFPREAFVQSLRELGYIEGRNITIEYRSADAKIDRFPDLAAELIRLKSDVIVAASNQAISALKQATRDVPIVMTTVGDPIGAGFIQSLARPGGNITGLTNVAEDLSAKRLELLKEISPKITHVGVLRNATIQTHDVFWKETQVAATALRVKLLALDFRGPDEFESAFATIARERAEAFIVLPDPLTTHRRQQIVDLAVKNRLPGMYPFSDFTEAGGLIYYGPSRTDLWRRAATYVDKILKGAKAADLPVERPVKFELVINLKAAKQIGITIPPNLLARADRVIK